MKGEVYPLGYVDGLSDARMDMIIPKISQDTPADMVGKLHVHISRLNIARHD